MKSERKTDYDIALQNLNYQKQRKVIVEKGASSEKLPEILQFSAINNSINQMKKFEYPSFQQKQFPDYVAGFREIVIIQYFIRTKSDEWRKH